MPEPFVSVVTPSYNQGRFIERTVRSVLDQEGCEVQYVVMDGGSQDETLSVLRRYESALRWRSEPDDGQADAVNKGICSTSGEVIGWLNSDDVYYPGALAAVQHYLERHPEIDVVYGDAHHIDEDDAIIESYYCEDWDPQRLREICFLCQPAVFFRRRVVDRHGLLDTSLRYSMDYEYWLRLSQGGARFGYLRRYLAGSRMYADNKTVSQRVPAHAEINHMLRRRLGAATDRWVANYAHVRLEEAGVRRETSPRWFAVAAAALTLGSSLRWNRRLSRRLLSECLGWVRSAFGRLPAGAPVSRSVARAGPARRPRSTAVRIGFDVSQTGSGKAGCGWYADSLMQRLPRIGSRHEYILYRTFGGGYWDPGGPGATRRIELPNVVDGPSQADQDSAREFWSGPAPDLEAQLGHPDVVHANNFFCPTGLSTARLVYTLYDLAFLDHPEWTTERNRCICFEGVLQASTRADLVVAISEASRRHFLRTFPHYPAERTAVVHPASRFDGVSATMQPPPGDELEPDGFFLTVATLDPRKNHDGLLQAYQEHARRRSSPRPLVLVGGSGWMSEELMRSLGNGHLRGRVVWLGYVSDEQLQWLYRNCFAFVYPSLAEGFGLPVVEAASQGAAVVSSRVPAIAETADDVALLVDPVQHRQISDALDRL